VIHFPPVAHGRFTLIDMRGTTILESSLANGANSITLPEQLVSGVYILKIQGDDRSGTQKLVIH
jgi:hypothetical protein